MSERHHIGDGCVDDLIERETATVPPSDPSGTNPSYALAHMNDRPTVPPSDPPGNDLRAAVEAIDLDWTDAGTADGPSFLLGGRVMQQRVLALIDAHRCYDEAALTEALHEWYASTPTDVLCEHDEAAAFILARLHKADR